MKFSRLAWLFSERFVLKDRQSSFHTVATHVKRLQTEQNHTYTLIAATAAATAGLTTLYASQSNTFRQDALPAEPACSGEATKTAPSVSHGLFTSHENQPFFRHGATAASEHMLTFASALFSSAIFRGPQIAHADAGQPPSPASSSAGPLSEKPSDASAGVLAAPEAGGQKKKKLVILGTGWGGMSILRGIDTRLYDVTIVAPRNYFLFTPLLPGVTSGSVEARSISEPIRRIMVRHKKQAQFIEAECVDVDPATKHITCRDASGKVAEGQEKFSLDYDILVVAVGAQANTFGTPGVLEHCHVLKEVDDAERIRESIVDCFEAACVPGLSDEDKQRLLHFVVVGGGPTGVEFSAELHDLIVDDMSRLYPGVASAARITLIQSADHILNMFDKRISDFARSKFSRDGVDIQTNARVVAVNDNDIVIQDKKTRQRQSIDYGLVVWSTGIGTRPLVTQLMQKIGQGDRRALATDEWLRVKGTFDVWALGDCSSIEHRRMQEDISLLFKMADTDGDGYLSAAELTQALSRVKERYPQIALYLKRSNFRQLLKECHKEVVADTAPAKGKEIKISIDDFEEALKQVDSQMKNLPATAQVAAQQGEYLADCFNKMARPNYPAEGPPRVRGTGQHRFHPFVYKHLGQFAPLGSGEAGVELPGDWVNVGRSTQWLWYSVYASKQVSWRTRALVVFDWTKRAIFGRDSSRM